MTSKGGQSPPLTPYQGITSPMTPYDYLDWGQSPQGDYIPLYVPFIF